MSTAAEDMLNALHRQFEAGNPLYAWQAVKFCAEQKLSVPDWCMAYLTESAIQLMKIAGEHTRSRSRYLTRRTGAKIASALGVSRAGWNAFDRMAHDRVVLQDLMNFVEAHHLGGSNSAADALTKIAERDNVTMKRIKRRLLEDRRRLDAEFKRSAEPTG